MFFNFKVEEKLFNKRTLLNTHYGVKQYFRIMDVVECQWSNKQMGPAGPTKEKFTKLSKNWVKPVIKHCKKECISEKR